MLCAIFTVFAASGAAQAPVEPPLLPLPGVQRPAPIDDDGPGAAKLVGCKAVKALPSSKDKLPFGPGELLSYDVALLGIRTGKVNLKMGDKTVVDGVATFPISAQAKSDGFLEALGNFDARMVSFFDPSTLLPVRMVNHVLAHQTFVATPIESREDGAFAKGAVNAKLHRTSKDGVVDKKSHITSSADVVDMLSVIYYLRGKELTDNAPFCFELYHRRRLWHVEGKVAPAPEVVTSPAGARRSHKLSATVTRIGGKDPPPPRPVTAWISDDADRFPVLVSTPDKLGNVEVRLTSFTRGHRLVAH